MTSSALTVSVECRWSPSRVRDGERSDVGVVDLGEDGRVESLETEAEEEA